nr:DUF4314 domain-containing protein [Hornefia porci]
MRFPSREIVEGIRKRYPAGSRIELVKMDDMQAPPAGTLGTVTGVDDIGSIMVRWDNGSSLSVCYGEDIVRRVCPVCGGSLTCHPALSRRDNKTEICPDCGTREALAAIGVDIEDQEGVIAAIHELKDEKVSE